MLGAALVLAACATMAPPQPPSLELPKPPLDLRASRKGDKVVLAWTTPATTTDRQKVRSRGATRICRALEPQMTVCGKPVAEAAPQPAASRDAKSSTTYTDTIPADLPSSAPSGFVSYAIEVTNAEGRSAGISNAVRVSVAPTLPPPPDFTARVASQGVVLTWTSAVPLSPPPAARYAYRVYRTLQGSELRNLVEEVAAGNESRLALTDSNIEWGKTYEYRCEAVTIIPVDGKPDISVDGDDSRPIQVFADDVFPPAVPSGLQAVFSGVGGQAFVDLIWAPVPDVDLAGYNVYRHELGATPMKLNAGPVAAPAYRDANVAPGKNYLYSVSAVDIRGNESPRSEESAESVP
jgi:hypothetical protein